MIRGKFVLYSLGDFIFNNKSNYPYGYIAKLYFRAESIEVRVYPFMTYNADDCLQPALVDEDLFREISQAFSIHPDMIRQDKLGFHFAVRLK
jgi:hypothetical protein